MNPNNVWKKNREFYIGVAGTVLEGLLSGSLFMLLYSVMRFLWDGQFDMNRVLVLTGVIAFIFLLRILIYSYGYQCPLRFFLGIPCPFCGMTRAFLCVLEGDLAKSFYFHPLWPIVLGIFIIFPLWKFRLLHLSDKWIDHGAFAIGILFLLCFIIRHVTHSPIVQIDFTKGFFHFFSYMNT